MIYKYLPQSRCIGNHQDWQLSGNTSQIYVKIKWKFKNMMVFHTTKIQPEIYFINLNKNFTYPVPPWYPGYCHNSSQTAIDVCHYHPGIITDIFTQIQWV